MATVLVFVWTPHWDLCGLNTPSMINKQEDFTLVLATEIDMYISIVHLLCSSDHFLADRRWSIPSYFFGDLDTSFWIESFV